jgi:hypothetical protein
MTRKEPSRRKAASKDHTKAARSQPDRYAIDMILKDRKRSGGWIDWSSNAKRSAKFEKRQ